MIIETVSDMTEFGQQIEVSLMVKPLGDGRAEIYTIDNIDYIRRLHMISLELDALNVARIIANNTLGRLVAEREFKTARDYL